jgi:hypothetical protein
MSISTKVLSTLGIAALVASSFVSTSAQTNGTLTAPLSNSSFTYCNWTNMMATTDVEAARQIVGNEAYFYVTENNTTYNVINGKCVANMVANRVPYITGHKTSFDINSFGSVTNVKLLNTSPDVKSVECDGNDTVIRFSDANQDVLTYNTIVGANDFDTPTYTTESNNVLKVTLKRKDSSFTGSNNATIYVNETMTTNYDAAYAPYFPATATVVASTGTYNAVPVTVDKTLSSSKLALTVYGVCDATKYAVSSSSSSMSSSSSSMNSSSSSMSSSSMKATTDTTTVAGGKGMLTRTGGAN